MPLTSKNRDNHNEFFDLRKKMFKSTLKNQRMAATTLHHGKRKGSFDPVQDFNEKGQGRFSRGGLFQTSSCMGFYNEKEIPEHFEKALPKVNLIDVVYNSPFQSANILLSNS